LVMSDLEHMGFLEPVETRNNVLRNYASYLVGINEYSGDPNQLYAEKITQFAREMKCDGVLFQDVFACRNLAPVLKLFKERARKAALPVLEMSFNNIGENIEQNRTRIEAFMEMLAQ
ncbi:hypothetical protein GF325_17390, partial [Candidatus Bathyarchaeota archaeon]|nr:hypothetical protein [Candidatus Bathyarchaeota archaeon]